MKFRLYIPNLYLLKHLITISLQIRLGKNLNMDFFLFFIFFISLLIFIDTAKPISGMNSEKPGPSRASSSNEEISLYKGPFTKPNIHPDNVHDPEFERIYKSQYQVFQNPEERLEGLEGYSKQLKTYNTELENYSMNYRKAGNDLMRSMIAKQAKMVVQKRLLLIENLEKHNLDEEVIERKLITGKDIHPNMKYKFPRAIRKEISHPYDKDKVKDLQEKGQLPKYPKRLLKDGTGPVPLLNVEIKLPDIPPGKERDAEFQRIRHIQELVYSKIPSERYTGIQEYGKLLIDYRKRIQTLRNTYKRSGKKSERKAIEGMRDLALQKRFVLIEQIKKLGLEEKIAKQQGLNPSDMDPYEAYSSKKIKRKYLDRLFEKNVLRDLQFQGEIPVYPEPVWRQD